MSYDNTIPSADAHDLNNEYDRGFEAGMTIRRIAKFYLMVLPDGQRFMMCDKCLEFYEEDIYTDYSFHYCPHCGAKITEVEK